MKRIRTLEEGRVPAKEAKNWRIEGEKKRITRKEYQWLLNSFELEGLMAQKGLWNLAKEKITKERGEHVESSWLREDERGEEERTARAEKKEEEGGEKRKRVEEKEENEMETVKRRCEGLVSVDAFEIFSQGRDLERCGDLSWEDPMEDSGNWSDD